MAKLITKLKFIKPGSKADSYLKYIATRPRAQRFGSHGLFTDDGVEIKLSKVSEKLKLHRGNVSTAILSLRREDAARLGYDKAVE